ncbi:MAG: cysteine synthase A [Bacillota bacterium]
MIHDNVLDLIGNTPIVRLNSVHAMNAVNLLAKIEMNNPGGSVKDRAALGMITDAEERGLLCTGCTLVEPSSGNTGISLAMVAAAKGYSMVVTMPENMTPERIALMERFGAEVILTSKDMGMKGAIKEAENLAASRGYVMLSQFDNEANPRYHSETTAREILSELGETLDYFVAGVGTGGTITGTGRVLKEAIPSLHIAAVEPSGSPVLSGGKPGSHSISGLGAGFIPSVLDIGLIDEVITVDDSEAHEMSLNLARYEGLMVGPSSGAAVAGALKLLGNMETTRTRREGGGSITVLTILPDTGERYLSL